MSLKKGRGLKLFVKTPEQDEAAFVRVMKVKTYSPGEQSVATHDQNYIDQEDDYSRHGVGMIDPGEVSFSVERDPTDAGQALIDSNLASELDFKIQWKDTSGETYTGTVTKAGTGEPNEESLLRNYSIKRQGAPVSFVAP